MFAQELLVDVHDFELLLLIEGVLLGKVEGIVPCLLAQVTRPEGEESATLLSVKA